MNTLIYIDLETDLENGCNGEFGPDDEIGAALLCGGLVTRSLSLGFLLSARTDEHTNTRDNHKMSMSVSDNNNNPRSRR